MHVDGCVNIEVCSLSKYMGASHEKLLLAVKGAK